MGGAGWAGSWACADAGGAVPRVWDMPKRPIVAPQATPGSPEQRGPLEQSFQALREELGLSETYPPEAVADAERAIAELALPERDETAVPFFTIDPPSARDLDQAMFLERAGQGYRVRYAIADVPAFVTPGGPLDAETRRRGQTMYFPDMRIPLHPAVLSEEAGSLLPGQVRPAYVWDFELDAQGEVASATVYRAQVRSTERFDYEQVQAEVDGGSPRESFALLKEIGEKRIALERARGGASLPMPEQEVTLVDGSYQMHLRPPVASEDWNAQISLMTGMAAADLMLQAKVGILRTMPPADEQAIARFRRQAKALGVPWEEGVPYGEFLRTLERTDGQHLALIYAATSLFRGAGYTPFDGSTPEQVEQAAVAAAYAHVTAPLRRLVDRFGLVICESVANGREVPGWVREALPTLPELMKASDTIAGKVERGSADAVEAAILSDKVGQTFAAVVVEQRDKGKLQVQLVDLPVVATCQGQAELGSTVQVTVVAADIAARTVTFELAKG